MEKRNIQVDFKTAVKWYKEGGELREIALQAFSETELKSKPLSWEEYCVENAGKPVYFMVNYDKVTICSVEKNIYSNTNTCPTEEYANAIIAFQKLLHLYHAWGGDGKGKYYIARSSVYNKPCIGESEMYKHVFSFEDEILAMHFLMTFEELLEEAEILL